MLRSQPGRKGDPGGDQARHLLTRLISTPGSNDTRGRKGLPSGIGIKYITGWSPAAHLAPEHVATLDKSNQTAEKKSEKCCFRA